MTFGHSGVRFEKQRKVVGIRTPAFPITPMLWETRDL
jgi:hypothetical protein